jgi:hypothetical protein
LLHAQRDRLNVVNERAIYTARLFGLSTSVKVRVALSVLALGGWVRPAPKREGEAPGRQRGDWEVNPQLWQDRP